MDIKNRFYMLLLFCCSSISLAVQRDSISIDPKWNYWHVETIAPNGDWVFVYQIFPNNRSISKAFTVNTDTKKRVEVTGLNYFKFTNSNFLLANKNKETVEVDLITQLQSSLGVLKQKDWIEKEQTLCYVNEQNELVLKQYNKTGSRIIWNKIEISKYYLNPSKTRLLYQEEGSTLLYQLNLKTLEEKQLLDTKETLPHYIQWNSKETALALSLKNKNILYVDVEKNIFKTIKLPIAKAPIVDLSISFFTNNDLYISYRIDNEIKDPTKDYLDIWNGNDRELKYKVLKKKEGELKAFNYSQSNDKLIELPRSEKQEYLNIGIPNCLLVYEPLELQDYSKYNEDIRYRILNLNTMQEKGDLTKAYNFGSLYNKSPNNRHILYRNKENWEVYDFENQKRIPIPHTDTSSTPFWTDDSNLVLYQDERNLLAYNLKTEQTEQLTNLEGANRFRFINTILTQNNTYIYLKTQLLFSIQHEDNKTSYYSWFKNKLTKIVDQTPNKLNTQYLSNGISADGKTVVWIEENYNLPQTVKVLRKGKVNTLLEPDLPKELYAWRKQKVIHYKDKHGVDLSGVLWYPKDYNPTKKYPMVTWIYEHLGHLRSDFEIPSLYNQHGFNRSLLNDEGYFVFQPDTNVSDEGPGLSAVECVTKGIETITAFEPSIDKTKLGLIGHSFGGYKTSFVLGNSKLFAAGISGAGIHDLIGFTNEYNYNLKMPNWFRVEGRQQYMKNSFGANSTKYYNNSPILYAQNYTAPVLLWTGLEDYNVTWENTRHMYIALKRYKKPVIALFYKKENHAIWSRREQIDLTYRVMDWFNFYLKDKKEIGWISKGTDYNSY